jgi:hypothetical protein
LEAFVERLTCVLAREEEEGFLHVARPMVLAMGPRTVAVFVKGGTFLPYSDEALRLLCNVNDFSE